MKYLLDLINLLTGLKKGIQAYAAKWQGQPYTPESIQADIDSLKTANDGLGNLEAELSRKQQEAHALKNQAQAIADKITNLAYAFHPDNPEQLVDYGLKPNKSKTAKPRPTKQLNVILEDDTDGEGFIVYTQVDPDANNYEWERGQGANATETKTIPEMRSFKYTSKTSFVDDDIAKGVRYFYRVRAVNSAGEGPWSEAVSRVQ